VGARQGFQFQVGLVQEDAFGFGEAVQGLVGGRLFGAAGGELGFHGQHGIDRVVHAEAQADALPVAVGVGGLLVGLVAQAQVALDVELVAADGDFSRPGVPRE
jgi:hypothetical protein